MSNLIWKHVLVWKQLAGLSLAIVFVATKAIPADRLSVEAPVREPPEWAYPLNRDRPKPIPDDGALLHVPGSNVALPVKAITDRFGAVDWHPDQHPAMPEVVAHGRKPEVFACAFCHYPNGQGRPENAALAGLSASYIARQMEDIKNGLRRSAQPAMLAPASMLPSAVHVSSEEIESAAAYFSSLPYRPWIRVVETDTVPRTEVAGISMLAPIVDGGTENIGDRIIEVPEDSSLTRLRDDAQGFIAYVPPGSVAKGDSLVHAAKGDRIPCDSCHGPQFKGTEIAPPLAGRSPGYLFRQLFDIRQGTRTGPAAAPMQQEVAKMTDAEMLSIVAYLASLRP
jgi:cytochrome c553